MPTKAQILSRLDSIDELVTALKIQADGLRKELLHFHGAARPGRGHRKCVLSQSTVSRVIGGRLNSKHKKIA